MHRIIQRGNVLCDFSVKLKSSSTYFLTKSCSFTTSRETGRINSHATALTNACIHMNVIFTVLLTVSNLERAGEKYNDPKTNELIQISCYRCNSHVCSAVSYFITVIAQGVHHLFVN